MKRSPILLLDFYRSGGPSEGLEEIFRSSVADHPTVRQYAADADPDSLCPMVAEVLAGQPPPLICLIIPRSAPTGLLEMLQHLLGMYSPPSPILLAFEDSEPKSIFSLSSVGAADFVCAPFTPADVLPRVWRLLERTIPEDEVDQALRERLGLKQLIGESPAFLAEVRKIPIVAKCDAGILITGETGTGKEMFARAIHYLSARAPKPFVPINCGAIPIDLVESEIFGHTKGAFTGASTSHVGLIGEADGGTILLDEIDCLPLLAQVKLLRFLQDKHYRPVGSARERVANVRVIAATNADITRAVEEGRLRRDLYYRLNVVPIVLPPLRERREDIPLLVRHFLDKYADEFDRPRVGLSSETMQALLLHDWPGNVRELEHSIERAIVLSENRPISIAAIAPRFEHPDPGSEPFKLAKSRVVSEFEKSYIKSLLLAHRGNISKSAHAAQKNRRAFFQLIRKHRIDVENFR